MNYEKSKNKGEGAGREGGAKFEVQVCSCEEE